MDPLKTVASLASTQKAFTLWDEFKKFAFKGNVVDLAVGVIIGAAFGKIIDSLVKHIIMPAISLVMPSEHSYTEWKLLVGDKEIPYGLFLGDIVNFLIVTLALFLIIKKLMGFLVREKKQEAAAPPPPTKDQELLTEIRDLLKQRGV